MIGYCCDGDERLLVAEYMPNDTFAKHLFHCMFSISTFCFFSNYFLLANNFVLDLLIFGFFLLE